MKFILSLLAVSALATSALADHYVRPGHPPHHGGHDDGDLILSASLGATTAYILTHNLDHYHAFMKETKTLAGEYLATGKGLENQALVAAMILVRKGDTSLTTEELALRIIDEANK